MATTRLIRLASILYGAILTVLLLVPDPAALLGWKHLPEPPGGRFVHLAFFTLLGLLACVSRWPVRGWVLLTVLAAYAVATELLQDLVPHRTPELVDLVEDFLGLGLGAYLGWIIQRRLEPDRPRFESEPLIGRGCGGPESRAENSGTGPAAGLSSAD